MKVGVALLAVGILAGCASQSDATKSLFAQESLIAGRCLGAVGQMPLEMRFTIDANNGRAPITAPTQCYTSQLIATAQMMRYPHADIVVSYSSYLTRLIDARNNQQISEKAAVEGYRHAMSLFQQSIASADAQVAARSRRDFADRLAALGTAVAAADRQRAANAAANRPVLCTSTGVYQTNSVICQ